MEFAKGELDVGRKLDADWSRLVPPVSGSAVPVFHVPWRDDVVKPNYFYQEAAWAGR